MTQIKPFKVAAIAFTSIVVSSIGVAQTNLDGPQLIRDAYSNLAGSDEIYMTITGTETFKNRTTTYSSNIAWSRPIGASPEVARLEILEFRDGIPTNRIVGDGSTLFSYDFQRQEYAVMRYGGYNGFVPSDYRSLLIQLATKVATGQASNGMRVLSDLVSDASATYRSWIPGIDPQVLPDGVTNDPVLPSRQYVASPTQSIVMYNPNPRKSVVFEIGYDSDTGALRLNNLYYNQIETLSGKPRTIEWTLTPYVGAPLDESHFKPLPGSSTVGWKPIVAPTPVVSR